MPRRRPKSSAAHTAIWAAAAALISAAMAAGGNTLYEIGHDVQAAVSPPVLGTALLVVDTVLYFGPQIAASIAGVARGRGDEARPHLLFLLAVAFAGTVGWLLGGWPPAEDHQAIWLLSFVPSVGFAYLAGAIGWRTARWNRRRAGQR